LSWPNMNNSRQVSMENTGKPNDIEFMSAAGENFRRLIRTLLKGNLKRARSLALEISREIPSDGERIALQNLIEDMAEGQALRNAFINLPSAVPGVGTVISWALISLEDFFVLDQSVTLIMALSILNGIDPDQDDGMEEFAIGVIGEVYGIEPSGADRASGAYVRNFLIKLLPAKYVNFGLMRWVKAFIRRLLPFRSKSRLMPIGIGVVVAAWDAYTTIVKVGRITLRELPGRIRRGSV